MKILVLADMRFKKDFEKLKRLLDYNAFRPFNSNTFVGDLSNDELLLLKNEIKSFSNENDTIIVIPICKSCMGKAEIIGENFPMEEEKYRIL